MPNIINTIPLYFTGITISLIYTYIVGAPMEQIALEILAPLPVTLQGSEYILVISDYFTKWTECYVFSNQEATTVADKLVNEFISQFGVPRQLHSDQATNFESNVMAEIC